MGTEQPESINRCSTGRVKRLALSGPSLKRTPSHKTARELEDADGNKYLVTILDLTKNELPLLEAIKDHASKHLANYYDYKPEEDVLRSYFHFPTGDVTSTLHLHVTLNREMHPLEKGRSFPLDDIINHLQTHDDVFDMVLQRDDTSGLLSGAPMDVLMEWAELVEGRGMVSVERGPFLVDGSGSLGGHFVFRELVVEA